MFASSKGASTSSIKHMGLGFDRNTAKINARAVNVCSPPDRSEIVVTFFPGGWHIISKPASSGSVLSTNASSALPP